MKWNKGKPPVEGWYPTRLPQYAWANSYRWWDGSIWSWAAFPHEDAQRAGRWAKKKETNFVSNQMVWSEMP